MTDLEFSLWVDPDGDEYVKLPGELGFVRLLRSEDDRAALRAAAQVQFVNDPGSLDFVLKVCDAMDTLSEGE